MRICTQQSAPAPAGRRHVGRSPRTVMALALGTALLLAACGSEAAVPTTVPTTSPTTSPTTVPASAPDTTAAPAAGDEPVVEIRDFSYGTPLTVPVGTTVRFINRDAAPHTVTATDGSFNSGGLGQDEEFLHTFTEAGEFEFECTFHFGMRGSITVTD